MEKMSLKKADIKVRADKMEERILKVRLLTPLFGYGAYNQKGGGIPEFRAAELKGMMRCLYRIACPAETEILAADEADLFGGGVGDREEEQGHASPVQLIVKCLKEWGHPGGQRQVLHKPSSNTNPEMNYLYKEPFEITIRKNKNIAGGKSGIAQTVSLDWYEELTVLTLLICGMGRRSRKGRGRAVIEGSEPKRNSEEALNWICGGLNRIAGATRAEANGSAVFYTIEEAGAGLKRQEIRAAFPLEEIRRPVIQKIWLGRRIGECGWNQKPGQTFEEKNPEMYSFLEAVDRACHDVKERAWNKSTSKDQCDIEETKKWKEKSEVMGSDRQGRFASALIIGVIPLEDGLYPLYTFVKAVRSNQAESSQKPGGKRQDNWFELDPDCRLREEFIEMVEGGLRKKVKR